jgi:hypothetical protein
MDEYNQGWDPEVRQYFRKILNSFGVFVTWLLFVSTLGLFMRMGYINGKWHWQNTVFYAFFLISFSFVLLFLFRTWRNKR